jgi:hypothetical protein
MILGSFGMPVPDWSGSYRWPVDQNRTLSTDGIQRNLTYLVDLDMSRNLATFGVLFLDFGSPSFIEALKVMISEDEYVIKG